MRAENLVIKLQLDALAASEREARQKRYESAHPTVSDEVVKQQKVDRLVNLRKKTKEVESQLELDRQLETESKKNLEATMKLRESRLTAQERRLKAAEIRRGQILYSRVIPELHPDWRQQAQEEFLAKKL